jgi:radical SAM superfamily enzyme YgiQ (UPF0313 family)
MRLYLVNLMDDMHRSYSNALVSQPPLSVWVLHALTPKDIDVQVIDEQIEDFRGDADAFAFSVTTQLARKAYDTADRMRAAGKTVILGGYHVTNCPEEAAEHADSIIVGEAETSWPTICSDLLAGRLRKRYIGMPTPPEKMPLIDRKALATKRYAMPAALYASRGCVYNCSFCGSSRILGGYRQKPLATLSKEIDDIHAAHGRALLQFTDDNLLADKNRRGLLLALLKQKGVRFICQITVDQLCDKDLMDALAAAGCIGAVAGIETLDDNNNKDINKMQNLRMPIADAVAYANSKGVSIGALLIIGLEHDTPERLASAVASLRAIPFALYDLTILRPLPGTPLYASMLKEKKVDKQWWIRPEPHLSNKVMPGYLRVYYRHPVMGAFELQQTACRMIADLNKTTAGDAWHVLRTFMRARSPFHGVQALAGRIFLRRTALAWQKSLAKVVDVAPDAV